MFGMGVYDQIKTAFQDIIAPEIHSLRGDIRVINERLAALDGKVGEVDARLNRKIDGLDARLNDRIDGLDARLNDRIDGLDARLGDKIDTLDARSGSRIDTVTTKIDSLQAQMMSMRNELISEIRRLDGRIDGVDRELHAAIDIRERLAALEARRAP